MIVIIGPGLIFLCVAWIVLVALAHLTAGALIAMVAILAGAIVLTACAVAWMHGRVVPAVEPPRSRLTARVLPYSEGLWQDPPKPVWPSEPRLAIAQPLTEEQLEAAARYMLARYGDKTLLPDLESIEPARKDDHGG